MTLCGLYTVSRLKKNPDRKSLFIYDQYISKTLQFSLIIIIQHGDYNGRAKPIVYCHAILSFSNTPVR